MIINEILIDTIRLDDIYPKDKPLDFIKIDVEGAEYLVLTGAINTILDKKPIIVFEFGKGASEYYGITPDLMYELITNKLKMQISLLSDWLENKLSLTQNEFKKQYDDHINWYFIASNRLF